MIYIKPIVIPAANGKSSFHRTFWEWMSRSGTGLGSFSTDSCVDRVYAKLQELEKGLDARIAALPEGDEERELCERVLGQLRNVMRRSITNRVAATRVTRD